MENRKLSLRKPNTKLCARVKLNYWEYIKLLVQWILGDTTQKINYWGKNNLAEEHKGTFLLVICWQLLFTIETKVIQNLPNPRSDKWKCRRKGPSRGFCFLTDLPNQIPCFPWRTSGNDVGPLPKKCSLRPRLHGRILLLCHPFTRYCGDCIKVYTSPSKFLYTLPLENVHGSARPL